MRSSLVFAAVLVVALGYAPLANADSVLLVNGNGILTGAQHVAVGGRLYDVTFVEGTCTAVFAGCDAVSDFDFATFQDAAVAAKALLGQVFVDSPAGDFGTHPELTFGCTDPFVCAAAIPNGLTGRGVVSGALAYNRPGGGLLTNFNFTVDLDTTDGQSVLASHAVWARFSPHPVPEPASLVLLGSGLSAVLVSRRRRRSAPTSMPARARIRATLAGLVLLCSAAFPLTAQADPVSVTMTTGIAVVGPTDVSGGEILAWGTDGFVFDASTESNNLSACCRQGETVSFSTDLSTPFFGSASLHGQHYLFGTDQGDAVWRFDTPFLTLPEHTDGVAELTAPFTLLPDSRVRLEDSSADPNPIHIALSGSGVAHATFFVSHPEGPGTRAAFSLDHVLFEFGRANPVPEPGSLLLIASVAALCWRRRTHPVG